MPFEVSPVLQERCIRESATIEVEKQFDHDRAVFLFFIKRPIKGISNIV